MSSPTPTIEVITNPWKFAAQFTREELEFGWGQRKGPRRLSYSDRRARAKKELATRGRDEVKICADCIYGQHDRCKNPDCPCICSEL